MLADQIQCSELKLNKMQCPNPAYVIVEKDGKDIVFCRLHFSLYNQQHLDEPTPIYRTLDAAYQKDADYLTNFIRNQKK